MGNKISKPARKLGKTVVSGEDLLRLLRAKLPPQALRDQFERGETQQEPAPEASQNASQKASQNTPQVSFDRQPQNAKPGKDGMDPSADQGFINSINRLGRQIETHSARNPAEQHDVTALKQLHSRKQLFEKGEKELDSQKNDHASTRTMIHPKTLTAVLNALQDGSAAEEVQKDYLVSADFLQNLKRFQAARNVVVLDEKIKEDEVGPKNAPAGRRGDETLELDPEHQERLLRLRKRLE